MKKKWFNAITIFIGTVLIMACEKPEVNLAVDDVPNGQSAVYVLNNNSGFDTVINLTRNLQGIGTAIGNIGLVDFTLESNGNLNYVYYTTLQSQQSNLYSYNRQSYNINSLANVALPAGADKSNQSGGYSFFRPYSNFFNYCMVTANTTAGNTVYSASFKGDVSAEIPKRNTILGEPDMGYLFPMLNSERFPGNPNYDMRQGFLTVGAITQVNSYLFKVCNPKYFSYQFTTNPITPKVVANLFDISTIHNGLAQSKYENISYSFDLRSDSLFAHHIFDTLINGYEGQGLIKITGIPVSSGLTNNSTFKKIRHYSADGKILAMFFQDVISKKCWTFSFDYVTHTFSKGIEGLALDYSTENSDIDIDELGNIYYSGIASNGSNINGVSIYKKSMSGATSLIGSDNFLKFGEIVQLKHLFGKIYLTVTGRIANTYYKQLSFLKQQ